MSLIVVDHPSRDGLGSMLETLETLRKQIEGGEVVSFCAVAVDAHDNCYAYQAAERHVTVLRQIGSVSHLLHCIQTGEV